MKTSIKKLLEDVRDGAVPVEQALLALKEAPFEDIGFAKVDLHRPVRQGAAEVIYGAGKTPPQIVAILGIMARHGQKNVIITRLSPEAAREVNAAFPIEYRAEARLGIAGGFPEPDGIGRIVVATGGTSDIPVAEEAALTAQMLGNDVLRLYDVGVAGLHRTLSHLDDLMSASVIVAVPTSVGYGASFGGISALLSMLNSCASGVTVVNIDNGFGAGYFASMVNHMEVKK